MRFDSRAWIIWVAAVAILSMSARNPFYSITLITLCLAAIHFFKRSESQFVSAFPYIALSILVFSSLYHVLFIHAGDSIILELPGWPLIGGIITLEALGDGLRNGLVLISLLAAFMALNAIVPSHELVRLIPPAFQDLSVVILIAVTYIPETRRHLQRIREAQAVRGHRPKGLRDWRPLFVPLLVGGLERAMQLSEAMVARGHAHASASGRRTAITLALVAGIVISISGWIVSVLWGGAGYIIMSAGVLILIIAIIHEGRKVKRTRFHSSNWSIMDTAMAAAAFLALLLVFVIWPLFGTRELNYNPYPVLGLPDYHPVMVVAFTLLTFPIASALFMQADTDNPEAKQYQATKKRDGMGQTP